jgi:hypothetical protein
LYCKQWRQDRDESYDLRRDMLDAQDWAELEHFELLLKPFDRATRRAEGNAITGSHGTLWEAIAIMDYLFNTLKKHANEVLESPHIFSDHYLL